MSKYMIMIEVSDDTEDGKPRWLHDDAAEAHLTPAQRETVQALYSYYQSLKSAWAMVAEMKARFRKAVEPFTLRKHQRWEQDAQAAERLLQEVG